MATPQVSGASTFRLDGFFSSQNASSTMRMSDNINAPIKMAFKRFLMTGFLRMFLSF
jgi:hypothetical protein